METVSYFPGQPHACSGAEFALKRDSRSCTNVLFLVQVFYARFAVKLKCMEGKSFYYMKLYTCGKIQYGCAG